jgi:hypothetical protein
MPSESVGNQEEKAELLNEFHDRLTALRAMFASINTNGRQVVRSTGGLPILTLERRQAPHRLAMNAVATLLIRHCSEVIAVTTPINYDIQRHDVSPPARSLPVEVLAVQEAEASTVWPS